MAYAYPSGFNTFVPSFEASGHLVVAFSREPKDFPLNQWISLTPVKKSVGYFLRITPEVAARVINTDLREFIWSDGDDSPDGIINQFLQEPPVDIARADIEDLKEWLVSLNATRANIRKLISRDDQFLARLLRTWLRKVLRRRADQESAVRDELKRRDKKG